MQLGADTSSWTHAFRDLTADTSQWDPTRQKVYAAPIDVPEVAEGANELSPNELLQATEPSDINHVWVVSRLAGSEEISLRTSR